ncbi:hypothetical protein KSP39_PZI024180 [Platanthera zijinensis]|uniref:Uncharacterized protein n=1 Tax=Platanthera zijinensis TaxID=2320716 RepID=A0AAP0ATH4_9ASPA
MYLYSITNNQPKDWARWLSRVECCYNTSYIALLTTPSDSFMGGIIPASCPTAFGGNTAMLETLDLELLDRDQLKEHIDSAPSKASLLEYRTGESYIMAILNPSLTEGWSKREER